MSELPLDLQSDPAGIPGATERLSVKALNTMDHIHRTLDSIRYNRATGSPWGPLVDHLYNLTGGLRDAQFWDGLPEDKRLEVLELESDPKDRKRMQQAKKIRELYRPYGWSGVSVLARPRKDGTPQFIPTPQDLDQMLEILMQLLHRHRFLWKTRLLAPLPPVPDVVAGR